MRAYGSASRLTANDKVKRRVAELAGDVAGDAEHVEELPLPRVCAFCAIGREPPGGLGLPLGHASIASNLLTGVKRVAAGPFRLRILIVLPGRRLDLLEQFASPAHGPRRAEFHH